MHLSTKRPNLSTKRRLRNVLSTKRPAFYIINYIAHGHSLTDNDSVTVSDNINSDITGTHINNDRDHKN